MPPAIDASPGDPAGTRRGHRILRACSSSAGIRRRHVARPDRVRQRAAAPARATTPRTPGRSRASGRCWPRSPSCGCPRSARTASPHLVPTWFWWDGEALLVFSKPDAVKVRNLRANPRLMVALGDPEDDFSVGLIEAEAHASSRAPPRSRTRSSPSTPASSGRRRPRPRDLPRDLHPGDPHRPDPLPRVARPRRRARRPRSGRERAVPSDAPRRCRPRATMLARRSRLTPPRARLAVLAAATARALGATACERWHADATTGATRSGRSARWTTSARCSARWR